VIPEVTAGAMKATHKLKYDSVLIVEVRKRTGSVVDEALRYKPAGCEIETR
jgi:hypothetical protein